MSAHSFPSLTSDSSSIPSRSSDLHESHNDQDAQASLSSRSRTSKPLSFKDPATNAELLQLRNRVSKLEQDKFVLGDYAAELQSRIRHLERERMEQHDEIEDRTDLASEKKKKVESRLSSIVRTSLSRPSTPTGQSRGVSPQTASFHRPSSSLSAATSTTAKRALSHASHRKTPSPTPSQLAFPSSTPKLRLVAKRGPRPVALEPVLSVVSEPPPYRESRRDSDCEFSTPTRRRLQAMYGRASLDAGAYSPTSNGGGPSTYAMNDYEPRPARDAHHNRIPNPNAMPSPREYSFHGRDPEAKRTGFTSKLDSIILTSKLFPLPSSRSKTPLAPVSPDHRTAANGRTAVIPLVHPVPSSSPHMGNVFLDSPPNKRSKVKLPQKGKKSLSLSLGLEENRQPTSDDRKPNSKSRGRVSFSERLFSSSPDRGDDTETDTEPVGRMWGSWGRKKRPPPPPLSFNKEKRAMSPPSTPPSAFVSRFNKSRTTDFAGSEEKRNTKRHSVTAGCLRSFVPGSAQRDKEESRVLRRSHSETRDSHSPPQGRARPDHGAGLSRNVSTKSKDSHEKRPITPSRVGSPMPKGRVPELVQAVDDLERTSSLRSAGRWGQRGRGFAKELTRRRTIHPMFSFERPGSADAVSTSSLRKADDEETPDEHRDVRVVDGARHGKVPRRTRPLALEPPPPSPSEFGASQSHATHAQDDSLASGHGHTGGATRSESGSAHKGKARMIHTRVGVQSHGTFAFEPAAAAVCPPRSAPPMDGDRTFARGGASSSSISRRPGVGARHDKAQSEPAKREAATPDGDREYLAFCEDLKRVLGDGEDWSSFKKYIRRFDIEVLSAELLLQRVKKLIDGSPVDRGTKLKLYERFVKIVHDNLEEQTILGA